MAFFTEKSERCFGENKPFQSRTGNNSYVVELIIWHIFYTLLFLCLGETSVLLAVEAVFLLFEVFF